MPATITALQLNPYRFAGDGPLWGIPHFLDVATNSVNQLFSAAGLWCFGRLMVTEANRLRPPTGSGP